MDKYVCTQYMYSKMVASLYVATITKRALSSQGRECCQGEQEKPFDLKAV